MPTSMTSKRLAGRLAALGAGSCALVIASTAFGQPAEPPTPNGGPADPGTCPPGAVCEATTIEPPVANPTIATDPATDPQTVTLPPPAPGSDPNAPRWILVKPGAGQGQVIIYEPGTAPPHTPGLVRPVPPPPPATGDDWTDNSERTWGVNLRAEGIMLPRREDSVNNAGMAGLGLSIRYRPIPYVAIDASVDFVGGVDSNGLDRQEIPFGLSSYFYVNPDDLAQFYLLGGIGWSVARVHSDTVQDNLAQGTEDSYAYFGGHAGLGLEFRITPLIGIDVDAVAFARVRTDSDGNGQYPEYVDWATGRSTNASAGGLLRAGVSFWW